LLLYWKNDILSLFNIEHVESLLKETFFLKKNIKYNVVIFDDVHSSI